MPKFILKNNVLNVIIGALLLMATAVEVVGIVGTLSGNADIAKVNYVYLGLQYVVGAILIVFAFVNAILTLKKGDTFNVVIINIIGNLLILGMGLILILEKDQTKFLPSTAVGISMYIEGVLLLLTNAIRKERILKTVYGIVIVTAGVIFFLYITNNILVYAITAVFFIFSLLYLIFGIVGLAKMQHGYKKLSREEEERRNQEALNLQVEAASVSSSAEEREEPKEETKPEETEEEVAQSIESAPVDENEKNGE